MARWYGEIGFAETVETKPGVWRERITKRNYYGDVGRNKRMLQSSSQVNDNINISNEISIVADPYANNHFHSIRYVEFQGAKWKVTDVTVQPPRLILSVGGCIRMASRLDLHEEFCNILENRNAYFQPPESIKMQYPCIRYSLSAPNQNYANDRNYSKTNCYDGIVIDYDPDSSIPDEILAHFPRCRLGDPYVADGLNHFPFTLYY